MSEEFKNAELKTGVVLLSHPLLTDPNFKRSVILICEHRVDGSVGLVVNELTDFQIGEVVDSLLSSNQTLFKGGPVQEDTLHILHNLPDRIRESSSVIEDLYWGGSYPDLQDYLTIYNTDEKNLRLFSGYSGWSEGQLQKEIEDGAWIVTEVDAKTILDTAPDALWRTILRSKGGEYAILANFPEDLRNN